MLIYLHSHFQSFCSLQNLFENYILSVIKFGSRATWDIFCSDRFHPHEERNAAVHVAWYLSSALLPWEKQTCFLQENSAFMVPSWKRGLTSELVSFWVLDFSLLMKRKFLFFVNYSVTDIW